MAALAPRSIETPWLRLRSLDERTAWMLLGAFWLVTRLIYLLNVMLGHHYPDDEFFLYAQRFSHGLLPYRDFQVEYPPLGIALIVLPGLIHSGPLTPWGYGTSFALEMMALDLLTLFLVVRLARGLIPSDPTGLISGLLYTGFVAASGAVAQKFDLVAGTFCLLAVMAFIRRRDSLAWVMLVAATLIKGFPLAIAPLFLMYRLMEGRAGYRSLYEGLRAAVGSSIAFTLPVLVIAGVQPLLHAVIYHVDRGTEIESMYSGVLLLAGRLFGLVTFSYANPADLSQDIQSPLDTLVSNIATPLGLALIALIYWQFYRALKARPQDGHQVLVRATLLVMLAFIVTFRALPGHYLLAVLPLAAMVRFQGRRQTVFVCMLLGALLLGQLETVFWQPLLVGAWSGILALVARNAAILGCFVLLFGGTMWGYLAPAMRRPAGPEAQASLGWTVEWGIRSWQELPAPFNSYRQQSSKREGMTPLRSAQHFYMNQQRHRIM
ncbi:MAG TPA: glycosyltransferase family 87 protein [Ktedonobacterales bacterium]|nr:glycosyltransferase family 87 protein [Ktedonobacterales bacterium]